MKIKLNPGAGRRYMAPYAELCSYEPAVIIAQSDDDLTGSTEDLTFDENIYQW